ncbi:hypothetical protein PAXRUDRAFT_785281 [Paxillus rubicundulus Ve08.2h10]|uniref:Tc1-like transposase DDE domain-containing protein n=1 Tax=Paxillus rubicundulus Ve08.2h10 TaxID=930991 RepID=A0A0D0E7H1_9AGAM|nr:hypothetical protein PAXRUDRAFT_785281 [Paxillus rubicundulus Ve08.2h10]
MPLVTAGFVTIMVSTYVDGHKCTNVIRYHQGVFIPAMIKNEQHLQIWEKDSVTSKLTLLPGERQVKEWFHNKVTFYANDWHHLGWIHIDAGSDPRPKGEGTSIMVSDFVSADRGWCRSPDGQESAWVLFRAGKAHDGWFMNDDILKQTSQTMDILEKHHPNSDHVLIFDNATTHLKRADNALSAQTCPKEQRNGG